MGCDPATRDNECRAAVPAETHWTGRMLAKAAGVSLRSVQRILEANQLAPHRIRTFKLSNGAKFADKLRDIVGLYVDPPAHTVTGMTHWYMQLPTIVGTWWTRSCGPAQVPSSRPSGPKKREPTKSSEGHPALRPSAAAQLALAIFLSRPIGRQPHDRSWTPRKTGASRRHWPAWDFIASSTCALTASRLNDAPFCIGGKSKAVRASLPTSCCTKMKRQNSRA